MTTFSVPDMHCDACVRSITGAVQRVDQRARVRVDLARLTVEIEASVPDAALAAAIADAGFTVGPA